MATRRNVALLLIHGMGEQRSYQITDDFVRNLATQYGTSPHNVSLTHHVVNELAGVGSTVRSHVGIALKDSQGPNKISNIDVHEVYWADKPKGWIRLQETLKWLAKTSMVPVRAWAQHAALLTSNPDQSRLGRVGFFLREILLAALLPLFGLALLALGSWLPGQIGDLWAAIKQNLLVVKPGVATIVELMLLMAVGLVLVASLWGAWGIGRLVSYEKRLALKKVPFEERWRRLRAWMILSIITGALVIPVIVIIAKIDSLRRTLGAITDVSDWGDFLTLLGIAAGVGAAWKASTFLVGWFGDVAIYFDGADQLSAYHTVRQEILRINSERLAELLRDEQYDDVYVAAHSLGSVIAYDAINQIASEHRAYRRSGPSVLPAIPADSREAAFQRLRGLMSFGSPLDKAVYFFHQTVKRERRVRAQILSSHTSFRRRRSGRPYGPYKFSPYQPEKPARFHWVNMWSWSDFLGHRLDYFHIEDQPETGYKRWKSHTQFWENPAFYREVVRWLEAPAMVVDDAVGDPSKIRVTLAGFDPGAPVVVEVSKAQSKVEKAEQSDPLHPDPIQTITDATGSASLVFSWVWSDTGTYAIRAFQERGSGNWVGSNAAWRFV